MLRKSLNYGFTGTAYCGVCSPRPSIDYKLACYSGKSTTLHYKMRTSNLRTSSGSNILKFHKHDWLMILFLAIIEIIILLWVPPFYRFVGKDMMTDLKYPLKGNTVPFWAVPIYSVLGPILVFLICYYRKRDPHDLHHALLGLCFSILLTAVITDSIKVAVGRPRPDFFWRCFPDGNEVYDIITLDVICTGKHSDIKEGHKSFPSGHSSWSFAGLGYLSWYLSGKLNLFDRKGHAAKLCIVFFPLLLASLVAISRVDDYWHHWQDVFAGGILGLVMATFCYRQFFPAPYHADCWLPYPFFPVNTDEHSHETGISGGWYDQQEASHDQHTTNYPHYYANEQGERGSGIGIHVEMGDRSFDPESGKRVKY